MSREKTQLSGKKSLRILLAVASQAIASVATVLLSVFAAQRVSAGEFGIFAIIVSTWIIISGSIRAMSGESFIYNFSRLKGELYSKKISSAISWGIISSAIAGILLVLFAFLIPNLTAPFALLALGLPALVSQDNVRFALSGRGQTGRALLIDVFFVCSLVVFVLVVFQPDSLIGILWCWTLSSWLAASVGLVSCRVRLNFKSGLIWYTSQKKELWTFASDFTVSNGIANATVFLVAIFGNLEDAGAIRGTQVLLIPILLVMRGASVAFGPFMAEAAHSGRRKSVFLVTVGLTATQFVAVAASWLALLIAPEPIVRALLGESTEATIELFPISALATLALGSATVAMMALKAAGMVSESLRMKLWTAPGTLGLVALGAAWFGAQGAQAGLAFGEGARTFWEWRVLGRWKNGSEREQ